MPHIKEPTPKIVFLMLSLKASGGNRVFIELANRLAIDYAVEIVHPANRGKTSLNINSSINVLGIGSLHAGAVWSAYNIILTILFLALRRRRAIIITSDPILTVLIRLFNQKLTYRFMQSDDYNIYNDGHVLKFKFLVTVYKTLTRWSYKFKVNYIYNSKFVYDRFLLISKRADVPLRIVHPGVDLDTFKTGDINDNIKSSIAIMARSHPMKGFNDFLVAWYNSASALREKVSTVFIISTDDLSGFKMPGLICITPKDDSEIAQVLKKTDIFVSTSWWEGFGLPPLEAMACGNSVILADAGGVHEYAVSGQNCLMYEPKNTVELQKCIEHLVDDRDLRNRLSKNGIITSRQFTWDQSATQLQSIIKLST